MLLYVLLLLKSSRSLDESCGNVCNVKVRTKFATFWSAALVSQGVCSVLFFKPLLLNRDILFVMSPVSSNSCSCGINLTVLESMTVIWGYKRLPMIMLFFGYVLIVSAADFSNLFIERSEREKVWCEVKETQPPITLPRKCTKVFLLIWLLHPCEASSESSLISNPAIHFRLHCALASSSFVLRPP